MKHKIKRCLALCLAVLLTISSVYVSPISVSDVFASSVDEGDTTTEKTEYTVSVPDTILNVEWGNLKVNDVDVVKNKVTLDTLTKEPNVTCDNYVFDGVSYDNDAKTIVVKSMQPNVGNPKISGLSKLAARDSCEYFVENVKSAWESTIQWNTVEQKNVTLSVSDGKLTVKAKNTFLFGKNEAHEAVIKATVGGKEISKTIELEKIDTKISVSASEVAAWTDKVTVTVNAKEIAGESVKVIAYKNGKEIDTAAVRLNDSGKGTTFFSLNENAEYKFVAEFSGNDTFNKATGTTTYTPSKANQEKFDISPEENVTFVYGDTEAKKIGKISGGTQSGKAWKYSFTCDEDINNSLSVDDKTGDIMFDPTSIAAGTYTVNAISRENNDYNSETVEEKLSIVIDKKELTMDENTIKGEKRAYNGEKEITVVGCVEKTKLVNKEEGKEIQLSTQGSVETADAGVNKNVEYEDFQLPEDLDKNYKLINPEVKETTVIIEKKEIVAVVSPTEITRAFNDLDNTSGLVVDVDKDNGFIGGKPEGYEAPKVIVNPDAKKKATDLTPGKGYDNYYIADVDSWNIKNESGNYKFKDASESGVTVEITEAPVDSWKDAVQLDQNTQNIYKKDAQEGPTFEIYYKEGATLSLEPTGNNSGFDIVEYKNSEGEWQETKNIALDNYSTLTLRLKNSSNNGVSEAVTVKVYKDVTDPKATIKIGGSTDGYTFGKNVTFGFFNKQTVTAEIKVEDPNTDEQNNSIVASGLSSAKYYVIDLEKDTTFTLDENSLGTDETKILPLLNSKVSNDIDVTKEQTTEVKLGSTDNPGNYIVFVMVTDNVGNTALYGSNGVVITNIIGDETTVEPYYEPKTPDENKAKKKDGVYYFKDKAEFYATANEVMDENNSPKVYAGIKSIQAQFENLDDKDKKDDPINMFSGKENPTLSELKAEVDTRYGDGKSKKETEYPNQIVSKSIAENEFTTIKYAIHVTSTDRAKDDRDSISHTADLNFVLDNLDPDVKATTVDKEYYNVYDNDIYYSNKALTLKTKITERFTDADHIFLTLTKNNDDPVRMSYSDWEKAIDADEYVGYKISGINDVTIDENNVNNVARTITFTVPAENNEGDFSYAVDVEDYSGNTGKTDAVAFCMDTTSPKVQVTYMADGKEKIKKSDDTVYLNETHDNFTVAISVTEQHFAKVTKEIDAGYNVSAKNKEKETVNVKKNGRSTELSNVVSGIKNRDEWSEGNDGVYNYTYVCDQDANYAFGPFTVTDLAGNTAEYTEDTFDPAEITLDKTRPTGEITVENLAAGGEKGKMSWDSLINKLTFGLFGKNTVTVSMTSDDITAGVKSTEYIITSGLKTEKDLKDETGWNKYSKEIRLNKNRDYVVYEKVVDKAGNTEYFGTDRVVVDDQDPKPVVKITPTTPSWGKGVYSAKDNPGFDVSVEEPLGENGSYAGLKTVKYTIKNGTTGTTESGTLASYSAGEHVKNYKGHVKINPTKFYSNNVTVSVEAIDYSTNGKTEESKAIKIDNKAPVVKFTFDTSDAKNGKYYNKDKKLTITVDERNFDKSYTPKVTSSTGKGYKFSGWTTKGETTTGTITFTGDADYTVSYFCYDLAGNKSNTEQLKEFTVDKTKPVIKVSYNNNSALNGTYYKDTRTATITVTEHNFNAASVTADITAKLNGTNITTPRVGKWSSRGDTHTATVTYGTDGDYTFSISATDLASNVSDPYSKDAFTVDLTKPTIEITGVKQNEAIKDEVKPVIKLNDVNYDRSKVSIKLTGVTKGVVNTDGMYTAANTAQGQTITFANFGKNMDDIYTLTAETTDKAGNTFSQSVTFSVNRDGSTYTYDDNTSKLLEGKFTNAPKDLVISEINVNTLKAREITITKNGTVVTLKEGQDYKVEASGSDVSWKEYVYTIFASNFTDEGEYTVAVYSEDEAGNKTSNAAKKKELSFVVDETSPVISVANIADRQRYKINSLEFTANVDDNMALDKVEYYINGELQDTYDAKMVTDVNGALQLKVPASTHWQEVSIKAYDKAGNDPTEISMKVLVTKNAWVQFYNNTPLFVGTIILILAVVGGIIVIIVKRRKKETEEKKTA